MFQPFLRFYTVYTLDSTIGIWCVSPLLEILLERRRGEGGPHVVPVSTLLEILLHEVPAIWWIPPQYW